MSPKSKPNLRLDKCITENADPLSYAISDIGSDLVLRAFIFQNGAIYREGRQLGTITAHDIDFSSKRFVGSGASGCIYCVRHKTTGTPLALKCIPINSKAHRDEVERELNILLSKYDTRCIVKNYGAFWDPVDHSISIPMEWMAYSVEDVSRFNSGLPEESAKAIIYQVTNALGYLHEVKKCIHRDLKCSNILISSEGENKLGDFGVSKILQTFNVNNNNTYVGTMAFMAPERLEEGSYDFSSDIWSLGMTFIAATTGNNPWDSGTGDHGEEGEKLNLFQLLKKISGNETPKLPSKYSFEAQDFVAQCLKRIPQERPSCRELLKHKFFEGMTAKKAMEQTKMLLTYTSKLVAQSARHFIEAASSTESA